MTAFLEIRYDPNGRRQVRITSEDHNWNSWNITSTYVWRTCGSCGATEQRVVGQHPTTTYRVDGVEYYRVHGVRIMEPVL